VAVNEGAPSSLRLRLERLFKGRGIVASVWEGGKPVQPVIVAEKA
jgi:hypothetical protein